MENNTQTAHFAPCAYLENDFVILDRDSPHNLWAQIQVYKVIS